MSSLLERGVKRRFKKKNIITFSSGAAQLSGSDDICYSDGSTTLLLPKDKPFQTASVLKLEDFVRIFMFSFPDDLILASCHQKIIFVHFISYIQASSSVTDVCDYFYFCF